MEVKYAGEQAEGALEECWGWGGQRSRCHAPQRALHLDRSHNRL